MSNDRRQIKYRNVWTILGRALEANEIDLDDTKTILSYLAYLHDAPLPALRACAPHRDDVNAFQYPSTGFPRVVFELRPRNRSPEGEEVFVWSVELADVDTLRLQDASNDG